MPGMGYSEGASDPQGPAVMGERVLTGIPNSTGKTPLA